ncbi:MULTISPECIES: DUF4238 domain-containing protein [unclassified Flavobacterium]|uniref:DUF4238 domain-containing protein n=1 Tax=unclassified Flavobacterium TaxID=196869 RepID=UPI0025B7C080|nr:MULTISPECIES: DUF4238 domain-containing protein [unclassified Flavobacterium]
MNNKHPKIQKQHRLSQVYLKKFGYLQDDVWMISVIKLGSKITENVKILEFTTEENIFDLPFGNIEEKRLFETLSGKIENQYNKLINNIENQNRLIPKDKDLLNHFVPNLLCRTTHFRRFINSLIENQESRKYLFDEITMFKGADSRIDIEVLIDISPPETRVNLITGILMNHLVYVFRHLKKIILKSPADYGWLTSDNPVYIDLQNDNGWLIPIEAEIYFPLSKKYCLFLFNENSKLNSNPLRKLKTDIVNTIDFNTFDTVAPKIARNLDKYLIFSERYEPSPIF